MYTVFLYFLNNKIVTQVTGVTYSCCPVVWKLPSARKQRNTYDVELKPCCVVCQPYAYTARIWTDRLQLQKTQHARSHHKSASVLSMLKASQSWELKIIIRKELLT